MYSRICSSTWYKYLLMISIDFMQKKDLCALVDLPSGVSKARDATGI